VAATQQQSHSHIKEDFVSHIYGLEAKRLP